MSSDYFKIVTNSGKSEKVKCGMMEAAKFYCNTHLANLMKEYKEKGENLFYFTPGFTDALQYFKLVLTSADRWDTTCVNPVIDYQTIANIDEPEKIVYKFLLVRMRTNLIIVANITDGVDTIKFVPTLPVNILNIAESSLASIRGKDGQIKQVFTNREMFENKMKALGVTF